MPKHRSWTDEQLIEAIAASKSYRNVLVRLGLIPAGGNYDQIKRRIRELSLSIDHFTGKGWNVGGAFRPKPATPLEMLLVEDTDVQSYKLKTKLFEKGLKLPKCNFVDGASNRKTGVFRLSLTT